MSFNDDDSRDFLRGTSRSNRMDFQPEEDDAKLGSNAGLLAAGIGLFAGGVVLDWLNRDKTQPRRSTRIRTTAASREEDFWLKSACGTRLRQRLRKQRTNYPLQKRPSRYCSVRRSFEQRQARGRI